jgi:hypothetical protein
MAGGDVTSYALLLLLALQYGTQPFLTARFLSAAGCDAHGVVLLTELAKAALCAASLAVQRQPGPRRGSSAAELRRAAAPAACYLVQNLLLQRAYADLDSLTFNCLNQTKLVATALALYVLLRQRQTAQQLVALAMLVLAGALLQLTGEQRAARGAAAAVGDFRRGVVVRLAGCGAGCGATAALCSNPGLALCGAQACLLASALSGLASALTQIATQVRTAARARSRGRCRVLFCTEEATLVPEKWPTLTRRRRRTARALAQQQRKSSAAFTLEMASFAHASPRLCSCQSCLPADAACLCGCASPC